MNRKTFTKLTLLGSAGLLTGCGVLSGKDSGVPTLDLSGDTGALKSELDGSFSLIKDLVSGEEEKFKINYPGEEEKESLTMTFTENNASDYTHLRLQKKNGEVANVVWDREGLLPVVQFTDDQGNILEKDGEKLSFGFNEVIESFSDLTDNGLLELAWKLVAIGLVVWIGANIAGAIISAIAFLAFNVFVLGAIIIAIEASIAILNWLAEHTGWDESDLQEFFDIVIAEFEDFFGRVSEFIDSYFSN